MESDELKGIIEVNPEIMGGTPVFVGTRVPLQNLIVLKVMNLSKISSKHFPP